MQILLPIIALLMLIQTAMAEFDAEPGAQRQNEVVVTVDDQSYTIPFWLYVPESSTAESTPDDQDQLPLVLFLHGRGECGNGGDELDRVAIHGPPKLIKHGQQFPFLLVAPQCPAPGDGQVKAAWQSDQLLKLLDYVSEQLPVDVDRVYVTGLSMGGFGTWRLAAAAPERFAAIIPICGGGDASLAEPLKYTPIWAFHGQQDKVVPPKLSEQMVAQINEAGGRAKLTIYPDAGHDAWTRAYEDPATFEWLLSNRRWTKIDED